MGGNPEQTSANLGNLEETMKMGKLIIAPLWIVAILSLGYLLGRWAFYASIANGDVLIRRGAKVELRDLRTYHPDGTVTRCLSGFCEDKQTP